MKRAVAVIVSIVFVLGFAGLTSARMGMKRTMETMGIKQVAGEVEAVDLKAKTITVKGMRGLLTADVNDKTVVKLGKENKAFTDLKVGDKVTLTFEVAEGKNLATVILVSPPAGTAPPEPHKPE